MIEELPDDIENDIDDIEPVGEEADAQLYEHFRVVVDKGQAMMRVDKYLFERIVNDDYRTIGDGYLQEMSMVCQDEYEMALAEGSASEETLEGMRQNIMAIEDAIRNLPAPGEDSTDLIVYEPADKGYKDWNEQLLAKAKLQESVHEEPARREEPEQERQARFHR